jgi:hypothetical protein
MGKVTDWKSPPVGRLYQFQFVCGIGSEQDDLLDGTKSLEGVSEFRVSGLDGRHQYGPKAGVEGEWSILKKRTLQF